MSRESVLEQSELPDWFDYPPEFRRIVDQGLLDFDPWIILQGNRLRTLHVGLRARYNSRELVPFARKEDCDDVACWEKGVPGIVIVHDYASPGWERRPGYDTFWDWLRDALEATIDYE